MSANIIPFFLNVVSDTFYFWNILKMVSSMYAWSIQECNRLQLLLMEPLNLF